MIPIQLLDDDDVRLIGQCLAAAAGGPFFPDWEFQTLFGLSRAEVRAVADGWPGNASEPTTRLAVVNAIANLRGYPHGEQVALARLVSASSERLRELQEKTKQTA